MNVIHRIEGADRFARSKFRTARNTNVRKFQSAVELKPPVPKGRLILIATDSHMNVAHCGHTDKFAKSAEILHRERKQNFLVSDKTRGLTVTANNVKPVVKPYWLVFRTDLA